MKIIAENSLKVFQILSIIKIRFRHFLNRRSHNDSVRDARCVV